MSTLNNPLTLPLGTLVRWESAVRDAMKRRMKDAMLRRIGRDEALPHKITFLSDPEDVKDNTKTEARNELRRELRRKVEAL